eukprot:GHVL01036500.1.p1 GENE.GHVL01036500.1~~GHVL01036500.1.p1  ORF type:complete len:141 (+),score=2.69 GHVL01036500.1:1182-1604(+)
MVNKVTTETRLRMLHWKILHNIYPTNILLYKIGISVSNCCTHCENEIDYIEHFFYFCPKIMSIWKCVEDKVNCKYNMIIKITVKEVFLGVFENSQSSKALISYVNYLIVIAKMCVGIYRYGSPLDIVCIFEKELLYRKVA